jgi:hypothetical protein
MRQRVNAIIERMVFRCLTVDAERHQTAEQSADRQPEATDERAIVVLNAPAVDDVETSSRRMR